MKIDNKIANNQYQIPQNINIKNHRAGFSSNPYAHLDEFIVKGETHKISKLRDILWIKCTEFADNLCKRKEKRTAAELTMQAAQSEIKKAAKLGVKLIVPYDESFKIARVNRVNDILLVLKEKGLKLPKKVRIVSEEISKKVFNDTLGKCPIITEPDNIFLANSPYIGKALIHEAGHLQHAKNAPELVRYLAENNFRFKQAYGIPIKNHVGEYASTNPIEFVAETFIGLFDGDKYNEQVMTLYEKLKGVLVK